MIKAKVIAVSGTPGTGKTTVAKALAKALKYSYVDVKKLIEDKKLGLGYDKKRQCLVVDPKKVNKALIEAVGKKDSVVDSHLSHYLPPKYVELCIITTCKLGELEKRLKKRGYPKGKIRENLDAEIFEVCRCEAIDMGHELLVIDTTKGHNIKKIIPFIKKVCRK
jgi:adenylate kinase